MSGKRPSFDRAIAAMAQKAEYTGEIQTRVSDEGEYLLNIKVTPFVPSVPEEYRERMLRNA